MDSIHRNIIIEYRKADKSDIETVTELLCELYNVEHDELTAENEKLFADKKQIFFLAFDGDKPVGVAHCSLRSEYVNGTELGGTIGYLEGIYIKPEYRLSGIAAALVDKCEHWAKSRNCKEFASDCLVDNTESYKFHLALGFAETERCIFFRKEL